MVASLIRRGGVALGAAAVTAAALLTGAGVLAAPAKTAAASGNSCGVVFDDFEYASRTDAAFAADGWVARSEAGGPGVSGATWSPDNITFPTVDGDRVAQLAGTTDGTAGGTSQAELYQGQNRFFDGTYAARVRFADAPASGTDGDHVNETFFAIGPAQRYDYDPLYSELDFSEYLPNGGWGVGGPIDYETSWNGYREDPWDPHNAHSSQNGSLDGWHLLVSQVSGGHVRYYIDGTLVGDHTVDDGTGTYPVYPRADMSLRFNLWFIDTAGHTSGSSTYHEQVDWTYYSRGEVVAPTDVTSRAAGYRNAGTGHADTLGSGSQCPQPGASPTTSPTTSPTSSPTTSPTTPADCAGAPAWDWGTVYLEGSRVTHGGHLWQANWWTQGSEPGLTAQWKDLGPC
jgi:hypothetical protein